MKKSTQAFKCILVVVIVTAFVGCKKELTTDVSKAATPVKVAMAPKKPIPSQGIVTQDDSTAVKKVN